MAINFTIRPMEPCERREVTRLAIRAFGPLVTLLFSHREHCVVATDGERILGAAVAKHRSVRIRGENRTVGILSWVMSDPRAHGAGIGGALVGAIHDWFDEQGCDLKLALVEGHNSASFRRFAERGYRRLRPGEQLAQWGAATLRLWLKLPHIGDIGHFVWACDDRETRAGEQATPQQHSERAGQPPQPRACGVAQLATGWAINAAIVLLLFWRVGLRPVFGTEALLTAAIVPAAVLALRNGAGALVLRCQGVRVRYRIWESAFVVSIPIAALFGGLLTVPGDVYPADEQFRSQNSRRQLGLSALTATLVMAGAALLLGLPQVTAAVPAQLVTSANLLRIALLTLLIFDGIIALFPFTAFLARRGWEWSPLAWAAGAAATAAAVVVPALIV